MIERILANASSQQLALDIFLPFQLQWDEAAP